MNQDELSRVQDFRQLKKQILNPPSKVAGALIMAIGMDYELTFSVGQGTVSDFYPNDRADLNGA